VGRQVAAKERGGGAPLSILLPLKIEGILLTSKTTTSPKDECFPLRRVLFEKLALVTGSGGYKSRATRAMALGVG
jgi:hypothetical protein